MGDFIPIPKYLEKLRRSGILRTNKFLVDFSIPPALQLTPPPEVQFNPDNVIVKLKEALNLGEFSYWAEQVDLPGVTMEAMPVRRYGYGPVEFKPHTPSFQDIDIVFRVDAKDQLVFSFLHTWMRSINEYHYRDLASNTGVVPGQAAFQLSYKQNYAMPITIYVFDDTGEPSLIVKLREAYPISIGNVQLHWESKEYLRLPVKFTYFTWHSEHPESITGSNPDF